MISILVLFLLIGCFEDDTPPSIFSKESGPVWEGHLVAGDPSIIRVGDTLRLYYTAVVLGDSTTDDRILIGSAKSTDGVNWEFAKPVSQGNPESIALVNDTSGWDKILETAHVQKVGNDYFMYYSGYSQGIERTGSLVAAAEIGVTKSTDAITFTRFRNTPVLKRDTENDKDGLFSPTVIEYNNKYYMVYTGWCLDSCMGEVQGFGLLGATSTDGINWTKKNETVIDNNDIKWGINSMEAELVYGPDNLFYLFFTSDISDTESAIGVARSQNPFGPWEVYPDPIITKTESWEGTGPIAPAVLFENGKIRIWYMAPVDDNFSDFYIGYAETYFPLNW